MLICNLSEKLKIDDLLVKALKINVYDENVFSSELILPSTMLPSSKNKLSLETILNENHFNSELHFMQNKSQTKNKNNINCRLR